MRQNIPSRCVVIPTTEGWKPTDLIRDIIDLIEAAVNQGSFESKVLVFSENWKDVLDSEYSSFSKISIRNRLLEMVNIDQVLLSSSLEDWQILVCECSGISNL